MSPVETFRHTLLVQKVAARREATEFPSEEAKRTYLKDHPNADPSEHSVKKLDPREYARERAKHAPPKKKTPFVGLPALMASKVAARYKALKDAA